MIRRSILAAVALILAITVVPVAAPSPARADIYTYTDENGVIHFTNTPPRRRRGVRVAIRAREPRPDDAPRASIGPRDTSPERYHRYDAFIREAAALYRLPEAFIRAVIRVESDYNVGVVSRVGAQGLMQLMPGTAAGMGVRDAFDPRQNILGGARYLRILANDFSGDLILTIAAYNAGPGAVQRYRGVPPYDETQRYVQRVLGWYWQYLQAESAAR
ncbi:lytic transglycosylase domain-containing protein [Sandaracinus amylolyticus]|uniref:Lytic transglycosylase, catalytic n=1 Tax=Sandaracinus amylolyticus TaxID=927083 RepID=A0A0F6WAB4_9BACT|nr:lytic transglycosylase domain-containing protein [Sandaracinus amylolyticus]AKF11377.1 Lytic transglycosylase, catalytic [Sandaracinus amylolyticus]